MSMKYFSTVFILMLLSNKGFSQSDNIPRGASNMPYTRYEASIDEARNGAVLLAQSFDQSKVESEATDGACVLLKNKGENVEWTVKTIGSGLNIRFSMPDSPDGKGNNSSLGIYINGKKVQDLAITSKWAWQYFTTQNIPKKDPSNDPKTGFPRMYFDEVRTILDKKVNPGDKVRLQNDLGNQPITIDFIEIEPVLPKIQIPVNYISVTDAPYNAIPDGDKDNWEAFSNCIAAATKNGKGIFIPAGLYKIGKTINLKNNSIKILGSGIWYTTLQFSETGEKMGAGFDADAENLEISNFSIKSDITVRTARCWGFSGSYRNSKISNIWIDHFSVGAWIANYGVPKFADNLVMKAMRIRNT
ncbi:MAG: carbohydrate-binding protein, partial [Flavobacterium sp.]